MGREAAPRSDWLHFPEWLTLAQACYLSGYDVDTMLEIINVDGVKVREGDGLIEKQSLWDWQEVCSELADWDD
jgi:hypothetical protein